MAKYEQIVDLFERRIQHGDYLVNSLPAENDLAIEVGVSRMTARKAILHLIQKGVLSRNDSGRLQVNQPDSKFFVFLVPTLMSWEIEREMRLIEKASLARGCKLRTVVYKHPDDPIIYDCAQGSGGIFFYPYFAASGEACYLESLGRLKRIQSRVVVLDEDATDIGFPSLVPFSPFYVNKLLDYLKELGHRSIVCLNTHPDGRVMAKRVDQYEQWCRIHQYDARVFERMPGASVDPMAHPAKTAHRLVKELLADGGLDATAVLCTALSTAMGAVSAFQESGVQVGSDVSVCCVTGEGQARYLYPSMTCLDDPDMSPYISCCLDWMQHKEGDWQMPLLLKPSDIKLFIGKSTGPAPAPEDAPPLRASRKDMAERVAS